MSGPAILAVIAALSPAAPLHLTVRYVPGDGGAVRVARLVCGIRPSATGYLRAVGPQRACGKARRRATILTHVPDDSKRACDQIYGGPEKARVTGRVGTKLVDRRLSRTDGCRIAEWDALVPLVPLHQIGG